MTTLPKAALAQMYGVAAQALDQGYMVDVYDEGGHYGGPHGDIQSVLDELGHSEMNKLAIMSADRDHCIGAVLFIHENSPEDNPADYSWTTNKEAKMQYITEGYRRL